MLDNIIMPAIAAALSETDAQNDMLLSVLRGILQYVEDGNVVELRPCGFVEEVKCAIKSVSGA